jgi:hypothetical protein
MTLKDTLPKFNCPNGSPQTCRWQHDQTDQPINDKGHPKVPRYIESNAVSLADGG